LLPDVDGTVLKVEKYDSYFRFSLTDVHISWSVKHNPDKPNTFLVIKEVDGKEFGLKEIEYSRLNIDNICKLFLMLLLNPDKYFELLTGQKASISKVELVNMSRVISGGFTSCVFSLDSSLK